MLRAIAISSALVFATTAFAQVRPGQKAPDFTLSDFNGSEFLLAAQKGKTVVLEWYNPDCPFVVYAHGESGPLRTLGNEWQDKDVVWVAINSGSPGKQGTGADRNNASITEYGIKYPVLEDSNGTVGRAYGAKTTPQMVVIGPDGKVKYTGALDNAPLGKPNSESYTPYLDRALAAVTQGGSVETARTQSYGCSVKY